MHPKQVVYQKKWRAKNPERHAELNNKYVKRSQLRAKLWKLVTNEFLQIQI